MTRRVPVLAGVVVAGLALSACASSSSQQISAGLQGWIGHHQSELIVSWGPPHETSTDGMGGTVLIYRFWKPRVGRFEGWNRVRMFYVNPEGTIYRWRWEGGDDIFCRSCWAHS